MNLRDVTVRTVSAIAPLRVAGVVLLTSLLATSSALAACGSHDGASAPDPSLPERPDASADGPPLGASTDPVRAGDALRVETRSEVSDAHALVDTKVCYLLTLLHADGTSSRVLPGTEILVEPANPALASSAPLEECETGGIVGASPGSTPAKITVGHGSNVVSGVSLVTVEGGAWTLSSSFAAGSGPTFAVGETSTIFAEATVAANPKRHPSAFLDGLRLVPTRAGGAWPFGAELVYAWLEIPAGAGVQVERITPHEDAWRVRGTAVGATTLSVTYKAPKNALSLAVPATVVALDGLSERLVRSVFTDARGYPFATSNAAHLAEGACFAPLIVAHYGTSDGTVSFDVSRVAGPWSATKTRGTARLTAGTAADQRCVTGEGLLDLAGCSIVGADCSTGGLEVVVEGSTLASISLEATSTSAITTQSSKAHFGKHVVCLPVKATLTRSTGVSYEATDLVGLAIASAADARIGGAGQAVFDPSGQPCLELSDRNNPSASPNVSGSGSTTIIVTAALGGSTAALEIKVNGAWIE